MTIIIGAGMAGLLAAAMMRSEASAVVEAQSAIPNNHSAVLRFRSRVVGDVINVPFKEVDCLKAVQPYKNPIADAMLYSKKTNGSYTLRSITSADAKISKRYIAPPDLIQRMAEACSCEFVFGQKIDLWAIQQNFGARIPMISTMPMPMLMDLIGWERRSEFRSIKGTNLRLKAANCEAYCSLYVPDPGYLFSRVSVTGDEIIAELPGIHSQDIKGDEHETMADAMELLGIDENLPYAEIEVTEQKYAKILPIDEQERRQFIVYATEQLGIYSLGRFATWRPGLLLDDVVNDVRVIQRLIRGESGYAHRLKE